MKRFLSLVAGGGSAVSAALLAPTVALAHTGIGHTHGFVHGLMHPATGVDHVLAMVAVGMLAAVLGGRALWLIPASFVSMAAVGGVLGVEGVPVPFTEAGIAVSVIALGLAIASQLKIPTAATAALVGVFGIYHGYAHGAEMPADASGLAYGIGFLMATATLHATGIGIGLGVGRLAEALSARFAQAGGAAIALAGVVLLAQTF